MATSLSGPDLAAVAAATQAWANAFNQADVDMALALYAPDAALWGTLAAALITSTAGIRQYFEAVCASRPPPQVVLGAQHIRVYGDLAVNTGRYHFTLTAGGVTSAVPARFSFTLRRQGGAWLIVDHHSSRLP